MIVKYVLKRGEKVKRTPEQLAQLEHLRNIKDEDIDFSDIPPTTDEWFERAIAKRNARLQAQKVAS